MGIDQFKKSLEEGTRNGGVAQEKDMTALRKRISKWADAVAHHGLNNFGDKIEILSIAGKSSYIVFSAGEYEQRVVRVDDFPYHGQLIHPEVVQFLNNKEMWQLPLPLVEKFTNQVNKYGIKEEVHTCGGCKGRGEVPCETCKRSGQVSCHACNGRGKNDCGSCNGRGSRACSRCSGSGSIKGDSSINYREIVCPSCNGRQQVTCDHCGGKGAFDCGTCNSTGRVQCSSCVGHGFITCGSCKGSGNQARCEYLRDAFIYKPAEAWLHSSFSNKSLGKRIESKVSEATDVSMIEEGMIPAEAFDVDLDQALKDFLKDSLSSLQQVDALGILGQDYRVLRQRIAIRKVEVLEIAYRHENKDYVIWSFGASGMWAASSPISEAREHLFEKVQESIKQKDLSTAWEDVDKTIEMAVGEKVNAEEYRKVRNKITATIKNQYLIGGILGGTIVPLIGNLFGFIVGLIYWNKFKGKIRLEKQRFLYPFAVSLFVGALFGGLVIRFIF